MPMLRRCRVLPLLRLLIFLLLLPTTPAYAEKSAADQIRSVREASNSALETGDMATFVQSLDADYVGTGGSGGHVRSREELAQQLGKRIAEAPGLHYIRTPNVLDVSEDYTRAFESGRWVEVLPSGDQRLLGRYAAHWVRRESRWVIHAEVFVTLSGTPQQ